MTFPLASEITTAETVASGCVSSKSAVVAEVSATEVTFSPKALGTALRLRSVCHPTRAAI